MEFWAVAQEEEETKIDECLAAKYPLDSEEVYPIDVLHIMHKPYGVLDDAKPRHNN